MKKLMLGNEALARGAYEAGVRVAAAYPGTPSTEVLENLSRYDEVHTQWSPNEKVALEVALGAAIAGGRSLAAMKHVGLNVAADPLFTSAYTGINGGLVVVVADDPGMHSSQNEQDSRAYAQAAHIPMLEPADSQEALDFTKLAFEISEAFDTPVLIRLTTRVAHSRSLVSIGSILGSEIKEYKKEISKYVMMPGNARVRRRVLLKRLEALETFGEDTDLHRLELGDRRIGIITAGGVYNSAREAAPRASFLKLGMVYPLPANLIKTFVRQVDKVFVVEELEPYMEAHIKAMGLEVLGKDIFPKEGEFSYEILAEGLRDAGVDRGLIDLSFEEHATPSTVGIPARPPVLCPGCPHRGTYYALSQLGLTVMGDIGCYTLGALPPLSAMESCICMGASIGNALGMEKVRGRDFARQMVAVIGDSTFIHSGITGLIDVVYNGGTTTVIILDNSTTGMTGHQEHPATGFDIKGAPAPQLDLVNLCKALGVKRVRVEDPFDLTAFKAAVREELAAEEPSVIIARRRCVLLDKVSLPKFQVEAETCIGCGLCIEVGCPALISGDVTSIDEGICNGCGLCAKVCPTAAIIQREER